jgi:hypothetical protein
VAGGRAARDRDGTVDSAGDARRGDEDLAEQVLPFWRPDGQPDAVKACAISIIGARKLPAA